MLALYVVLFAGWNKLSIIFDGRCNKLARRPEDGAEISN